MKYFLYARKSSEDEERQVMSIEAQLAELAEYAKRESLDVVETFVESKSAKSPGREVFSKLIAAVHNSKEAVGILAWHPDRLARNSIDGGQIIYLIDTLKIASLRFPTFWFEPTPQGLFMLQVAFGQSKYYSDNLSENVKRGIRQKLRRGEWCGVAPFGYVNNLKAHNIEPDEVKAKIVRKCFEEFANGEHNLATMAARLSFWGVVSKNGKHKGKSAIHHLLTNVVYIGILKVNGESYEGSFKPIVSRATFEAVQSRLKQASRPRKSKVRHDFPFVGLFRCGECNCSITAQFAKGHGGLYRYYRCSKKKGKCGQGYVQEKDLLVQIQSRLVKVALSDKWKEKMLNKIEEWSKQEKFSNSAFAQNLNEKLKETDQQLNKLISGYLEGLFEKETYLERKELLIKQKTALAAKKEGFGQSPNNWLEPLKNWVLEAHSAKALAVSNNFTEVKLFVEKIGTNRRLFEKTVSWDWQKPFCLLAGAGQGERSEQGVASKNLQNTNWLGW